MSLVRSLKAVLVALAMASALPSPAGKISSAAAGVSMGFGNLCKPNLCQKAFAECNGSQMALEPYAVNISSWDNETKMYTSAGQIMSHALQEDEASQFGIFLHGPLMRQEDNSSPDQTVPPIYFSASFKNKVWRLDNVAMDQPSDGNWTGDVTLMGEAVAPSTTFPITEASSGKLKGLLVAEGNPFFFNHLNGTMSMNKGGVGYMGTDSGAKADGEQCTNLFPTATWHPYDGLGQVVNTVDCHVPSGMCFFSVWKFYDDSVPEMFAPDCLYWCSPDDIHNPTKCVASGVVKDDKGNKICSQKKGPAGSHIGGAVHGFTVGNTDPKDSSQFDLILIFTGGAEFDTGQSSLHKLKMRTLLDNVETLSMEDFATDLWKYTIPSGFDVGLDHAWVDATRKLMWVTSFRKHNPGVHMVDYETGNLLYTIRGFDTYFPGQYTYPAGVSGFGTMGRKGSYLTIATSTQKGLTVPPILDFGKAALFVMDISKIINVKAFKCKAGQCVPDPQGIGLDECNKVCS